MNTVYSSWHDLKYWNWKYLENPNRVGQLMTWLAESGDQIVGHYSVIPVQLEINGKIIIAAQSVDTATHPNYHRRGIFQTLAKRTYSDAEQNGIHVLYGFASPPKGRVTYDGAASYLGLKNKLEWQQVCMIRRMVKILRPLNMLRSNKSATPDFEDSFSLPKNMRKEMKIEEVRQNEVVKLNLSNLGKVIGRKIFLKRDAGYLNWRTNDPDSKYKIMIARKDDEIKGYVILKCNKNNMNGIIVDIFAKPKSNELRALISISTAYFKKVGMKYVRCWQLPTSPYLGDFFKEGYVSTKTRAAFLTRISDIYLSKQPFNSEMIRSYRNWYLTSLDSDHE